MPLFLQRWWKIKILVTTNGDYLKLIDAYTGEPLADLRNNTAKFTKACYSPDGSLVFAGDDAGNITLYDAKRGQMVRFLAFQK